MSPKIKGYILAAIAAMTYGMNPLFALPLYKNGMDSDSVLFFRYLFAIPIIASMIIIRKQNFKLKKQVLIPLIIMGFMVAISSLTLFLSYNCMDVSIASTILFIYPIIVAIIMSVIFKEKLSNITIICLIIAFGGIILLYKGKDGTSLSTLGVLFVLISAFSYAIYIIGVNRPILKNVPTLKITFYSLILGIFIFLIRLDWGTNIIIPNQWNLWLNLLALAIFPTTISFLCTTLAIQYIGATPTAILGALEPVTAVFFGVFIFNEELTNRIIFGIFLIITSVTLIIAYTDIKNHLLRFRKMFSAAQLRKKHPKI